MTPTPTEAELHARAAANRKTMTPSAARLWSLLRGRRAGGLRFRREHVFAPYILDFYCAEARLAVEVDGATHDSEEQREHDARRDGFLRRAGVMVLRVPAQALMYEPEAVTAWIVERCAAASAASASTMVREESGGR